MEVKGKMKKRRREKRKDSNTFIMLALQHVNLCCHASVCALFTVVLAVGLACLCR